MCAACYFRFWILWNPDRISGNYPLDNRCNCNSNEIMEIIRRLDIFWLYVLQQTIAWYVCYIWIFVQIKDLIFSVVRCILLWSYLEFHTYQTLMWTNYNVSNAVQFAILSFFSVWSFPLFHWMRVVFSFSCTDYFWIQAWKFFLSFPF